MNILNLNELSEQELDTLAKKISAIKSERRQTKIASLIKHFKDAWNELESEGVNICCNGYYEPEDALELDSITFDY